jgi:hypothetical protein
VIANATRRSERLEVAARPRVDSIVFGGSRAPPVEADRACELDAVEASVEAGNQPPNLQRIEARIEIVKIHPRVERDSHPPQSGDELARPAYVAAQASEHRRRAPAPGMPRRRAVALGPAKADNA